MSKTAEGERDTLPTLKLNKTASSTELWAASQIAPPPFSLNTTCTA